MSGCCGGNNKTKNVTIRDSCDEFDSYTRIILALLVTLRRPEDKECVEDILRHCTRLHNSGKAAVRKCNNEFLAYFIRVLHTNAATQPLEIYDQWYRVGLGTPEAQTTARNWLDENKSYFAMTKAPDGGIIFYSAVAMDPTAGWDKGGIGKKLMEEDEDFPRWE